MLVKVAGSVTDVRPEKPLKIAGGSVIIVVDAKSIDARLVAAAPVIGLTRR